MDEALVLNSLFLSQDRVLKNNISKFNEQFLLLNECTNLLITFKHKQHNNDSAESVFSLFYIDAFSTLVNIIKLVFYGADTDAFALFRVIVENLSQFEYIIKNNKFDQIHHFIQSKKNFPSEYSWKNVSKNLPTGDIRREVYGLLSNIGSHSTSLRLSSVVFDEEGKILPKFIVHNENPLTELNVKLCLTIMMVFFDVIKTFFFQYPELGAYESFSKNTEGIVNRYKELYKD